MTYKKLNIKTDVLIFPSYVWCAQMWNEKQYRILSNFQTCIIHWWITWSLVNQLDGDIRFISGATYRPNNTRSLVSRLERCKKLSYLETWKWTVYITLTGSRHGLSKGATAFSQMHNMAIENYFYAYFQVKSKTLNNYYAVRERQKIKTDHF